VLRIKAQLDKGASLDAVTAQLADSLATQVATILGISVQAAHAQLTQAFTQALQTSGSGPLASTNLERASPLATRFRQVAELATRVTNGETGTPIRLIAGQRSDATSAGADPAPNQTQTQTQTDQLLRGALDALAAAPSPVPTAIASVTTAAVSDRRTVALTPTQTAIATGGDTLLGRALARAVVAAEGRSAQANVPTRTTATAPAAANPADSTATATSTPSTEGKPQAAVDAFVHAFVTALAQSDGGHAAGTNLGAQSAAAFTPVPMHVAAVADASASQPVASFAIPIGHDAAPVAPPAPAPTLPQSQQVDANAVVDQLLRGMQINTGDGTSTVRLRLVPEQLGDVSVKLVVSGGSVDASITAHTADAQNALAGAQTQLAKNLADAGLKLQSFTVGLAGGGFAGTRDQAQRDPASRQSQQKSGIAPILSGEDETGDPHGLLASPTFGPPVYRASRGLGALNYLV
jgi:flagellar hook-length control protein FliK